VVGFGCLSLKAESQAEHVEIDDFREALAAARADLTDGLDKACGGATAECASQDQSRFSDSAKNRAFYNLTRIYGMSTVYANNAQGAEPFEQAIWSNAS
jgi:hypothetical protein